MKIKKIEFVLLILVCIFCLLAIIINFIGYDKYFYNNEIKEMVDCGFGILLFALFLFMNIFSWFIESKPNDLEDRIIELEHDNEINSSNIHCLINNLNELYIDVHENRGD